MKKKVEFISYDYNDSLNLIKIKTNIDNKEVFLAMIGEEFDNMICQISGKNLFFSVEQRKNNLLPNLMGKTFYFDMNADINKDIKIENNDEKIKNLHEVIDTYPFYEICQDIIAEKKTE
jgi:hypothetical protein